MAKKYWLLKTEHDAYSIDDLQRDGTTYWDGVRNYQARNLLRDDFQEGDQALIYHSGGKAPAAVGTATITKAGYPDPTQFDRRSKYFDEKSSPEEPRWYVVDVTFESKFAQPVTLTEMRGVKALSEMGLLRRGNRLSVQPVTKRQFDTVVKLGRSSE